MQLNNYIGGKWQDAGDAKYVPVTNPANGEELAQVRLSTKEDVISSGSGCKGSAEEMGACSSTEASRLFI